MKRVIMIGLGCLFLAGCGPEGTSDMKDEEAPLLSTNGVEAPAETAMDQGGIENSIKPCPACSGQWNAPESVLDYAIPESIEVSSSELRLVLRFEDADPQTCVFETVSRADTVVVACGSKGTPSSADLMFLSGSQWMQMSLVIVPADSTASH